jgi:hypothetical protein
MLSFDDGLDGDRGPIEQSDPPVLTIPGTGVSFPAALVTKREESGAGAPKLIFRREFVISD